MTTVLYETHRMPNRYLPFIFHPDSIRTAPESPANWHENIELLYCVSGSGRIRCGTRIIPFHPGDLVVINADTLHSFGADTQLRYHCLIIDNSFFQNNGIPIKNLYFQEQIRSEYIRATFRQITLAYEQLDTEDYHTILRVRTSVLNLIEALCRECTVSRPAEKHSNHIKQAITYLRQNLDKPITLDELADYVGISKYHLSRQFKIHTGSTVFKTLNAMRCAQALRLMSEGMRVSEAARSSGFENLSYFTKVFSGLYHCLPSQCIPKS